MRTRLLLLLLGSQSVLLAGGCGPRLSHEDLGTVVYEIPAVPGAEKPYTVPGLDEEPMQADGDAPQDAGPAEK